MSRENVEIVRRLFERYSASDVEGWIGLWSSDAEFTAFAFAAIEGQPRVYRGHTGLRRFQADTLEAFAEVRIDPSEFRDAGDVVVALGKLRVKGAASGGAAPAASMGWLFEVRAGVIVRGRDFLDQAKALEAAGLRE
jgi:ketosteroid isomerase-like protein